MTSSKLTNKRNRKNLINKEKSKTINKNNLEPNQNEEQSLQENQQGNQKIKRNKKQITNPKTFNLSNTVLSR